MISIIPANTNQLLQRLCTYDEHNYYLQNEMLKGARSIVYMSVSGPKSEDWSRDLEFKYLELVLFCYWEKLCANHNRQA